MNSKKILITGASHGIGQAIATRFAAEGYTLILNCKTDRAGLFALSDKLQKDFHVPVHPLCFDVGEHEAVCEMFAQIRSLFDGEGVDILINNAGISHIGLLSDTSIEEWNHVLSTNLTSVYSCCHEAIPYMVHQKYGRILNISSVWGSVGASCEVAYSASKGGVNSFTKALAKELAPSSICVNAIACGIIDTRMNACFDEAERAALEEEIPIGRFGSPEEVAELSLQLICSPSYLTGQIVTLDGGWQS